MGHGPVTGASGASRAPGLWLVAVEEWRRAWHRLLRQHRLLGSVLFVLAMFVCTGQSLVAYVATALCETAECCSDEPGDEERECPCPLDCAMGCGAAVARALPPEPSFELVAPAPKSDPVRLIAERTPGEPDLPGFVHVPKRAG